jgi:hypothetical protein
LFSDPPSAAELGIFLTGGAEQTGTTDLIRTAGAMKAGGTPPRSNLSGGLVEHEGTPVRILGGAAPGDGMFCGLNPINELGRTVLILTGAPADEGGRKVLWGLPLGGYWGLRLGREEYIHDGFCN